MEKIRGKVIILGDDVDTDQILPGYAMSEPYEEIGKYAMAGLPTENFKLNREPGCILVAGRNFGCGSSREQAPIALKQAQVALVVAQGFARIFRRNCINIGLPIMECPEAAEKIDAGDDIDVDFTTGVITNNTKGETYQSEPLPEFLRNLIASEGLANYTKKKLQEK